MERIAIVSEQARQFLWFVDHTPAGAPCDLTDAAWSGRGSRNSAGSSMTWSVGAGLGCLLIAVEGDDIERELMDGRTGAVENLARRRGNQLASVCPVLELRRQGP